MRVNGSGVHVDSVASNYYYFTQAAVTGEQVCDRHHEVVYYAGGARLSREIDPPGCLYPAVVASSGDYFSSTSISTRTSPYVRGRRTRRPRKNGRPTLVRCVP